MLLTYGVHCYLKGAVSIGLNQQTKWKGRSMQRATSSIIVASRVGTVVIRETLILLVYIIIRQAGEDKYNPPIPLIWLPCSTSCRWKVSSLLTQSHCVSFALGTRVGMERVAFLYTGAYTAATKPPSDILVFQQVLVETLLQLCPNVAIVKLLPHQVRRRDV